MKGFSSRLKKCRQKKKSADSRWTQKYVAEKIGMARTTYTAYENGTKMPPADTINNIAILFDVSNDYLMGRTEDEKFQNETPTAYKENFTYLPVVSQMNCQAPFFTTNQIIDHFPVDNHLLTGGKYVWFQAKDHSMINAGIREGSKVLIHLQSDVKNGEVAAICLDEGNVMLKKVYMSGNDITVVSENPGDEDVMYPKSRVAIIGKGVYVSSVL